MFKTVLIFSFFISALFSSQSLGKLTYTTEKVENGYLFYAENNEVMPMSATFVFTLENMRSSLPNNKTVLIPAKTKKFLLSTFTVIQQNKNAKFKSDSSYNFGDVTQTTFDEDYIYDLPFANGKTYLIFQGYNGKTSHQNQSSLDFNFKTGDKIYAAREGKVVATEEKFNSSCNTKDCAKFNNLILIQHPDGTFGEYLHLKQNGVEVNVGDDIKKGQFIGYSGNTGWSSGPHLHFGVFLNRMDGKRSFIKTKFRTSKSPGDYLEEKKSYTKNY